MESFIETHTHGWEANMLVWRRRGVGYTKEDVINDITPGYFKEYWVEAKVAWLSGASGQEEFDTWSKLPDPFNKVV